jgi:N-acetylmuramoyl-L-alanine amidase
MKVAVDAGHGGADPGAIGPGGLKEAEVTLYVAHSLRHALNRLKYDVVLTRNGPQALNADKGQDLAKRCGASDDAGADCFVSIHCNAAADHGAGGFEVFHCPGSERGKHLAQSVLDTLQSIGLVQGGDPAKASVGYKLRNRGVKQATLYVVKRTKAPSILVELAFISNPVEEALLRDTAWISRIVDTIAGGIDAWGKNR